MEVFAAVSNPRPSPPCSLITVRASLSLDPANLECRRWFDSRFTLQPFMASATKSRAQRLLRVDPAQTKHDSQTL